MKIIRIIKNYKILLIFFFFNQETSALSPEYEKELYIGCYGNSKQYLGPKDAYTYCTCTIDKLSNRFSDKELDLIFNQKSEEIMKATEFATIECEDNK